MGITFGKFGSRAATGAQGSTVSFGEHFAASEQFDAIFKQGMALVERTASYLDGPGRKEAKALKAPLTLVYATESMRLTTRLLELASWLLIRRAVKDGELSTEEAAQKRERVKLQPLGRPSHVRGYAELPEGLRELVDASFSLNDRIIQLDRALQVQVDRDGMIAQANPVDNQVQQLQAALAQQVSLPRRH